MLIYWPNLCKVPPFAALKFIATVATVAVFLRQRPSTLATLFTLRKLIEDALICIVVYLGIF